MRAKIKEDNPDATFGETSKLIGEKWRALNENEKEEYKKKAAEDKRAKSYPHSLPVEVLDPYTLRQVKAYQTVAATETSLDGRTKFSRFLDKGGGYKDGLVYRYKYHYQGVPRKTIKELVASIVKLKPVKKKKRNGTTSEIQPKKKHKVSRPLRSIEVLDPYTLRPVKVYKSVRATVIAETSCLHINYQQILLRKFLDNGGGYKSGFVYRYQYHYEGVPRKTIKELVASVVKGDVVKRGRTLSSKPPMIPVEVLDPYTLRPVKVYKSVSAAVVAETSLHINLTTLRKFLDNGGGYKSGFVYRYQYHYEGVPRKTIKELVASVVKGDVVKRGRTLVPVEVLDPYTLRPVKVYKSVNAAVVAESSLQINLTTLRKFLDNGGGYKSGFVYRYQYHYEGVPRKTIKELVASVVNCGKSLPSSSECLRGGCTTRCSIVNFDGYCRSCHIVLQQLANFQNQMACQLKELCFASFGRNVRVNGTATASLPDFHKIQNNVLGILHADGNGHEGKWYDKDIQETSDIFDWAHHVGISRVFILRYDHKDYVEFPSHHKDAIISIFTSLFDDAFFDPETGLNFISSPGNGMVKTVIYLNYDIKSRFLEGVRKFGSNAIRAEFDDEGGGCLFVSDESLRGYMETESNSRAIYFATQNDNTIIS